QSPQTMPPPAVVQPALPDLTAQKANDQYGGKAVQGGTMNNTQLAQNPAGNQVNNSDPDAQKRANAYKAAGPPGRGAQAGPPLNNTTPDAGMPPGGMTQSGTLPPAAPDGPGGVAAPAKPAPAPATGTLAGSAGPSPTPGVGGGQLGSTAGPAPGPASAAGAPGGGA